MAGFWRHKLVGVWTAKRILIAVSQDITPYKRVSISQQTHILTYSWVNKSNISLCCQIQIIYLHILISLDAVFCFAYLYMPYESWLYFTWLLNYIELTGVIVFFGKKGLTYSVQIIRHQRLLQLIGWRINRFFNPLESQHFKKYQARRCPTRAVPARQFRIINTRWFRQLCRDWDFGTGFELICSSTRNTTRPRGQDYVFGVRGSCYIGSDQYIWTQSGSIYIGS